MAGVSSIVTKDPRLGEALERGFTLPAEWYTDPSVFELEKERIFRRFWQYVGYTEQVARPGEFLTCSLGDIPIVVLRDGEGALRAFANVCRHRGSQIVLDAGGHRKTLQCHYHGWTWNLDGSLRNAPRWNEQPGFNKDEFPLFPVQVETWGPMIFVNPDPNAGPLSAMTGELPQIVATTGLDLDALTFRERREYDIAANWKVVVENFNECYHCPVAHPSFSDLFDLNTYTVDTQHEWFSTQHGSVAASAQAGEGRGLYDVSDDILRAGVREGRFIFLWPTLMLDISPGPHNLVASQLRPLDAHRSRRTLDWFFAEGVGDDEARGMIDFIHQVLSEDIVLCESVQRGLRSGFYTQGRLMVSRENGVHHFQNLVHRVLTAE